MPELVTIPGIELCETGVDWPASTGPVTFTSDDLISAVEAPLQDAAVKLPRLIFGHTEAGTTWEESMGAIRSMPCVGKFTNLRTENENNLLVGDLTGIPKWLAEILPTAYPSRSIEAYFEVSTNTGHTHRMIIPAVAFLGEELPGVQTLEDLEYLFSDQPTEWIDALTVNGAKVMASQQKPGGDPIPARRVAASVDTSDVRSAFYEQVATEEEGRYWWWLHQVYIDPTVVIAEDEQMEYWLVPYDPAKPDEMFADPVQVYMQWVEQDSGQVAASATIQLPEQYGHAETTFALASDSRPAARQAEWAEQHESKETKAVTVIDIPALRSTTGLTEEELPDDATTEQINEALAAKSEADAGDEEPDDDDEPDDDEPDEEDEDAKAAAAKVGKDGVTIEASAWQETQEYVRTQKKKERVEYIDAAVKDRKIPPARKAHYLSLMDQDEQGTREFIDKLEKNAVPGPEQGHGANPEDEPTQASGTGLLPELAQKEG